MNGPRLGSRGLAALRAQLSERDVAVVQQVADLKLMSARQIEAVHFRTDQHATALTAARTCRRVLERLVRDRLLVRLARRVGGVRAGSASFVYGLGPVGHRVLNRGQPRHRFREPTATFVMHSLAVADIVVRLTRAALDEVLEVVEVQAEPACWRPLDDHGAYWLRPDLFVSVAVGDYEFRSFVEVDLGTESLPRLLGKCHAYEAYYQSDAEQRTHGVFPRVVWLLQAAERAQRFARAIAATPSLTGQLFAAVPIDGVVDALTDGTQAEDNGDAA